MRLFIGKISRELFRPVWRHAEHRLKPQIDELRQRIDALGYAGQAANGLSDPKSGLDQYIPAFLSAVRTVRAFGHELGKQQRETAQLAGEVAELRDGIERRLGERLEFIRREIMLEMRYAPSNSLGNSQTATKIVSPDALRGENIRLNLGCGHVALDGYVNVDMRDLPGVDIVAPAGGLPLEQGTVSEIYSSHLIEHFPQEMLRRRLLPYWCDLLKPAGTFRAVALDGEAMIRAVGEGACGIEDVREVLFGAQDYEGGFHFNLLWPDGLAGLLAEAGFEDIDVLARGRRNGKCFEFEIAARKPN